MRELNKNKLKGRFDLEKLLIIMEKPSARVNMSTALGGDTGTFEGESYTIINLYGHILEHGKPKEVAKPEYRALIGDFNVLDGIPWSFDYFDFRNMKPRDSGNIRLILSQIKTHLSDGYIPVIGTDLDPSCEGDLLAHEVLQNLDYKGKIYRMYHLDEEPESLRKAFRSKKEITGSDSRLLAAETRRATDYLTQELTRVATLKLQNQGYDLPRPVPVGRLQSTILNYVGSQLDAIANYKPHSVFESRYKLDQLVLSHKGIEQFKMKEEWSPNGLPEEATVVLKKETPGRTPPPKPLTLNKLTGIMSGKGMSIKTTLALYQAMYESPGGGYLTYPRTEDNFVSPEQFETLLPHVDELLDLMKAPKEVFTHRNARSTHVKTGGSHGALRPGVLMPKSLEELDVKFGKGASEIYKIVTNAYLMMFLEDTEWIRYDYETVGTDPVFKGSIRMVTKAGAQDPDEDTSDQVTELPDLNKKAILYPHEVKSVKPANPTTKWLLKQLEKDDVGTPSTQPQTVSEMTGDSVKHPLKQGKVLGLSPIGHVGYQYAKAMKLGTAEGTRMLHGWMKSIKEEKQSQAEVLPLISQLLSEEVTNLQNAVIDLSITGLPEGGRVQGVWNGREVSFKRIYAGHLFTDEEVAKLLAGETIRIEGKSKDGDNTFMLEGKLEEQEYKGRPFVGFKGGFVDDTPRFTGMWQGEEVTVKGVFAGHTFTEEEQRALLSGATIEILAKKKSGESFVAKGKLEKQEYKGREFVGFSLIFEPREGYVSGVWNGKKVSFKNSFMGHEFTEDEIKQLLDGKKIVIQGTTKGGGTMMVGGGLANQTYKGRNFVGFKAEFDNKQGKGDGLL